MDDGGFYRRETADDYCPPVEWDDDNDDSDEERAEGYVGDMETEQ